MKRFQAVAYVIEYVGGEIGCHTHLVNKSVTEMSMENSESEMVDQNKKAAVTVHQKNLTK